MFWFLCLLVIFNSFFSKLKHLKTKQQSNDTDLYSETEKQREFNLLDCGAMASVQLNASPRKQKWNQNKKQKKDNDEKSSKRKLNSVC